MSMDSEFVYLYHASYLEEFTRYDLWVKVYNYQPLSHESHVTQVFVLKYVEFDTSS